MLLLGSKSWTINGVTVYPDHVDPTQYWYLPAPVTLGKRADGSGLADFSFIKYRPVAASHTKGGGFVMFTSNLTLDPDTVEEIRGQLPPSPTGDPNRLTAVGYDEGTVQCIALNLQGSGGTNAQPPRDGMLVAVEEILGASTPSLAGDNAAAFSLTLSEEGATILEQAFEDGLTPIGVIYSLKYTGIRPSLDVVIEADMSRVFDDLSMGLSAQVYWVQAGLDAEFEHLKQDGTIKITVTNYTSDQEMKDKENWALDFFKNQILADWFRPSLTPPPPLNPMGTTGTTGTTGNRTTNPVTSTPPRPSTPATSTPPRTSIPGVTGAGTSGGVPGATGSAIPGVGGTTPPRTTPAASGAPAATGGAGGSAIPGVSGAPGVGAGAAGGAASGGSAIPGVGGMPGVGGGVPGVGGGVPGVGGAAPGGGAPAGAGAGAAAAGGSSASPFGASFRLRYVSEEEKKTVRVEYHRSDAVQRTYAPQGFFGVLIPQDHREKYILEVDLDDPFFRQFTVNVGPAEGFDFGRIGLDSIHVAINYGDPNDAQNFKHGEFIFDTNNRAPQQWAVYRLDAYDRTYSYLVDYHFSPQAGWDAADDSYSLPAVTTEDEDLYLNPYEFLSFLEVKLVPGRIDWTVVDSIELFFSRDADASGWAPTKAFLLQQSTPPQSWKLRLGKKGADPTYSYRITHHLKDGTTIAIPTTTSKQSAVIVEDPFPTALSVQIQPLLDPTKTKQAFVDLQYSDPDNNYSHAEHVTLTPASQSAQSVRVPLLDATKTAFQYRVTLVGVNDQINQGAWQQSTDPRVFVSDSQ